MKRIKAVGFGALNIDELYRVQSVLADDETLIKEHKSTPGGSAANTIYGLAKLGVSTGFIGAVGLDEAGELLLQDFRNVGTDCAQIKIKQRAQTGSVLGLTDSHGKRALYVASGANRLLSKKDINLEYMAQAELVHLSSFVDEKQFELQKWAVSNLPDSTKISFAPGALYIRKGLNALDPILSKTDILFANETEIVELTGAEFRAAARYFLNNGCKIVVITLGKGTLQKINKLQFMFEFDKQKALPVYNVNNINSNHVTGKNKIELLRFPSYVADANNEYVIESQSEYGKDTTGAGDAFAAGFLYGLLNKKNIEQCGRLGNIVAQFSITKIGARQGLPTFDELSKRYQQIYGKPL